MGTCYTTMAHKHVKKWMKQFNINLRQNGKMLFDGAEFMDYVNVGGGLPFSLQAFKFLRDGSRLKSRLRQNPENPALIEEAAQTTLDWLRARDLPKMERFLHRVMTINGYGFLDETPAIQAHRWVDWRLMVSGAFNQLHMPVEGWSEFWRRLAEDLDVRLSTPVIRIERFKEQVVINTKTGPETFDAVVCAMPLDEFLPLLDGAAEDETFVANAINWQGYTTSLIATAAPFTENHLAGYSSTLLPGAEKGHLLGARREVYEPDLGGHLYVVGQLSAGLNDADLKETCIAHLKDRGADLTAFIMQENWKYFALYDRDAIRNGLLQTMERIQGQRRTWYTGASFSFEAISHICRFNDDLASQILAASTTRMGAAA